MHRLFVALRLTDDVVAALGELQWGVSRCRWVDPDQLHLTVRFIGEVRPDESSRIQASLATIEAAPVDVQLGGVGHFPPRGEPRVLWAGVRPSEALEALRSQVDRALESAGIPREPRRFRPHITLGRLRRAPVSEVQGFLVQNALFSSAVFQATSLELLHSVLLPEGADYRPVMRHPLRA